MNLTLPTRGIINIATNAERNPREGLRRLNAAIAVYGNDDTQTKEYALDAYIDGRASYWTTVTYHSQTAVCLCHAANLMSSLEAAIDAEIPAHRSWMVEQMLDTLVPMNLEAAKELAKAYERVGSWRTCEELEDRRVRDSRRAA